MIDGDVEAGSLMAGQSVGFVTREQRTEEILDELISQAVAVLAARGASVHDPLLSLQQVSRGSRGAEE